MFEPVTYSKTGLALHWREHDLEQTAKALIVINPHYEDWWKQADYIQLHASRMIEDSPTIVGTGGWYVTMFLNGSGEAHCSVTLMPYSVLKYLEKQGVAVA